MEDDIYQYNRSYKAIIDTYQRAFVENATEQTKEMCDDAGDMNLLTFIYMVMGIVIDTKEGRLRLIESIDWLIYRLEREFHR